MQEMAGEQVLDHQHRGGTEADLVGIESVGDDVTADQHSGSQLTVVFVGLDVDLVEAPYRIVQAEAHGSRRYGAWARPR